MTSPAGGFTVHVAKEALKFSAAHFIAYRGFRERLHGHNYTVAVTIEGDLGADGYVLDFGLVKRVAKQICAALDERVLVPRSSEALTVIERDDTVEIVCEDGARFILPAADAIVLPIAHSSAEELARYVCEQLTNALCATPSTALRAVEVAVAEAPGQSASYRRAL
jgi:6-pyruvoyltetrahydropterin/6-carboxytetrahydropterin synthase